MANGGLPAGEKGRSYSACVNSVIMYESEIWPDLVQGWLDGCATLGLRKEFLQRNLRLDLKSVAWGIVYWIEDCNGLVI